MEGHSVKAPVLPLPTLNINQKVFSLIISLTVKLSTNIAEIIWKEPYNYQPFNNASSAGKRLAASLIMRLVSLTNLGESKSFALFRSEPIS